MNLPDLFIQNIIKRFLSYKELGDKTLGQLNEEQLHYRPNEESNSIATIVQHLHGNMMSRFTNFLTEDGEKSWRKRDAEFEEANLDRDTILAKWEAGWKTVLDALNALNDEDLSKEITIRSEKLFVYDALLRQLAHYPSHVGQMMYIGKMLKGKDWKSLSIPKGESKAYNDSMMGKQSS